MGSVSREVLAETAAFIYRYFQATPQYHWPLLSERCGVEVWVKHENVTPVGAFKVRGGLVYCDHLRKSEPSVQGLITATRGNHGQSIGYAAQQFNLSATIVVPEANSPDKNRAMQALGVELLAEGADFQVSREAADSLARERGLHYVPSFHPLLVRGVATYSFELLSAVPDLDTVYVPIGLGSGICGLIAARNALGLSTKIVGVVSEGAPAYAHSFEAQKPVSTETAQTIADGVACRVPDPEALALILKGVDRVVAVPDSAIMAAIQAYFTDTHHIAEGAGAVPLAALLQEKQQMAGKKVGLILSGGNIDYAVFRQAFEPAACSV